MSDIFVITRDLSYPGGTEYFLIDYLLYLAKQKKQTSITLLEVDGTGKFENKEIYSKFKENAVNVLTLPQEIAALEFWDSEKIIYINQLISQYKPSVVHTFLFYADFVAFYLKAGSSVVSDRISELKTDLFFTEFPTAFDKLPDVAPHDFRWISSKFNNFSIALEQDTPSWKTKKDFIDNKLEPIVSAYPDVITAVSKGIFAKWSPWTHRPVIIVPCSAVDKSNLSEIDQMRLGNLPQSGKPVTFVCVSRLVPDKGLEDLIESFKRAVDVNKNIRLLIIGSGELASSLKAKAKNIKEIIFLGYINHHKVLKFLVGSDVFVTASHSEGLPLSIQEAMACYLPIIATNVGGIPDLVNNTNGILFNPGDLDSLYNAIIKLSTDFETRQKMGNKSRQTIEKGYLKEHVHEALFNLYENENH